MSSNFPGHVYAATSMLAITPNAPRMTQAMLDAFPSRSAIADAQDDQADLLWVIAPSATFASVPARYIDMALALLRKGGTMLVFASHDAEAAAAVREGLLDLLALDRMALAGMARS
jgi:hypothetical protein